VLLELVRDTGVPRHDEHDEHDEQGADQAAAEELFNPPVAGLRARPAVAPPRWRRLRPWRQAPRAGASRSATAPQASRSARAAADGARRARPAATPSPPRPRLAPTVGSPSWQ
jgi:hypothetical protein